MRLPAGRYRVSAYLRADREGVGTYLGVSGFKDAPGSTVQAGREWRQESLEFEVPENTRWVHFAVRPEQRGVIWVDAVQVQAVQ